MSAAAEDVRGGSKDGQAPELSDLEEDDGRCVYLLQQLSDNDGVELKLEQGRISDDVELLV